MNLSERKKIDDFKDILIEKTDFKKVYSILLRNGVIPVSLKAFENVATDKKSDQEHNKILYDVIKTRGKTAFSHLKQALKLSNPDLFEQFEGRKWDVSDEQWLCSPMEYNLSDAKVRGIYCIVCYSGDREGSDKDVENAEKTFKQLQFEGFKCINPDPVKKELENLLTKFTSIKDAGCFVFVLCGHGGTMQKHEAVLHTDGSYKMIDDILLKICDAPALVNKPKLIILQLCRGNSETTFGVKSTPTHGTEVPGIKDTIILKPSLPGHVAYRDTIQGGWFITVLMEMILKYKQTKDIQEIMIEVYNTLEKMRENKSKKEAQKSQLKMEETTRIWTKDEGNVEDLNKKRRKR